MINASAHIGMKVSAIFLITCKLDGYVKGNYPIMLWSHTEIPFVQHVSSAQAMGNFQICIKSEKTEHPVE